MEIKKILHSFLRKLEKIAENFTHLVDTALNKIFIFVFEISLTEPTNF